jgi:translocation and assembly module TamB
MKKTHKIILAGLATLLVLAGIAWKLAAPRVLAGVQDLLLKQVNSSINGRLEIGSLDFSVLGSAVLKQVVLYDKAGSRIASGEQINVSYQFDDLLGGRFGLDSVKKISVEKADLKLAIDKNGRWSLQELVKPQKEQPTVFRGIIALQEVMVEVTTPEWKRQFTGLAGELDYEKPPAVAVDLKGKLGKSSLTAKGVWTADVKTQLAITVDAIELADVQSLLPSAAGNPKFLAGSLKEVKGNLIQDKSGISTNGEAVLSGLAMNLQGKALKEGNAKLKLQGKSMTLSNGSAQLDGNKLTANGTIDFATASPGLALQLAAAGIDIASLAGSKASLSGLLSFQADVTGTLAKTLARGVFKLPAGQLDANPLTDGEGSFSFAGETLTIQNATLKALGGALAISGTMEPQTSRYNLKVSGQNVDGAILTNQGVTGRMSFEATVSGAADASSMTASGVFSLPSAKISDYDISNATGSFRKQGNRLDLSNVGVTLSGQRLSVGGSVTLATGGGSPQLNLTISSGGLNANVFNPKSALKGSIAFQATVTGTPQKNQVRGNFQIGSGALGELAFSAASGGFSYIDGVLTLSGGRAQCLGGSLTLSGTVVPKTMEYRQQVNGANIDAAQLTDKDVQGRADFTATISGIGDWDKANGDGNFKMNSGSVKGISFNGLTGNFSKRGRQTEFTNLKFNMLGGLASGTGATEGEYIRLIITPNAAANTALSILTGKTLQPQDLRIRFRGPNG